ncbi:MAG TPA: N-acetylglucosamine-6-phosphate deacetylase [Clostridiales bacterium]|nr:MAG: N-acetylglucosamine-6-phosphate deacetylase [Firmicutes bacterium ADurb.Bin262]HOU10957.1 N-acetylglucosamine-6-phosphate deacetylase [Clostridiales bacterium]HQH62198.1 N-acetylglucosamine-6-phosphate deacetylase [Clostridiales bacterium]
MLLKNAVYYGADFEPARGDIAVEGEKIAGVGVLFHEGESIDLGGLTVLPGFIDIHIHGSAGGDMSDASEESLQKMSLYLAANGVTSFCPASMTLPEEQLAKQFQTVESFKGKEKGAYIHGINMEGPFISLAQKGAQPAEYIRPPDFGEFSRLNAISRIVLVDVAPELPGAFDFARRACRCCTVSQAHTAADFPTAEEAYRNGFSHATHLFSAMPPVEHRAPGPVVAAFDNAASTAELICDGIHAHPPVLRMAFKLLGEDRVVVVSDAMKAAGMQDGEYELGGQTVYVRQGKATLADGRLAASTVNLFREYQNLLSFGIDPKAALKACTINPARVIGADAATGSIKPGKYADLLVTDTRSVLAVLVKGRLLFRKF